MLRVLISFSGGRTSAYMTLICVSLCRGLGIEYIIVFANTGREDERTLKFVDDLDRFYGLGIVWVEALVSPRLGDATTFRPVTFETATRRDDPDQPFEHVIAKYGIANASYLHCNRELKLRPIHAYAQSVGWEKLSYETAIGIRADEIDRQNSQAKELRLVYPLIPMRIKKPHVRAWADRLPFRLDLSEEWGNCIECHKKTERKLLTLMQDAPEVFDFFTEMEAKYAFAGASDGTPRRIYRKNWTTLDLKSRARLPFKRFVEEAPPPFDPELDVAGSCGDSCDLYPEGPTSPPSIFDAMEAA